jgi:hypothetical protein
MNWTEDDIRVGLGLLAKMELLLDDLNYLEDRGLLYQKLKFHANGIKVEAGRHIKNFFDNSTEDVQRDFYGVVEGIRGGVDESLKVKV